MENLELKKDTKVLEEFTELSQKAKSDPGSFWDMQDHIQATPKQV